MSGKIKQLLDAGEKVRVMSSGSLISPKMIDAIGSLGIVDGIWIDQEHNDIHHRDLELMLMACRSAGLDAFSRVPPNDYGTIMRPYEAGCSGVMVAQVRTLDQVETAVQWAKFPPLGTRGMFGANAESNYGSLSPPEYVEMANRDRWVAIQIETAEAVEIADQIAATEGVDLLFIGPADLAVTLGVPGDLLNPKCVAALQRVSSAAQAAGIRWGAVSPTLEHARKCSELGCQLHSVFGEFTALKQGLLAQQETFREI